MSLERSGSEGQLAEAMLVAAERERGQVVAVLHDQVLQHLALAGLRADLAVDTAISGDPARARDELSAARQALQLAVDQLRSLMIDCRPFNVGHETLPEAFEDLLLQISATGIPVRLSGALDPNLPPRLQVLLYRFVQHLLSLERGASGRRRLGVRLTKRGVKVTARPHFACAPVDGAAGPGADGLWEEGLRVLAREIGAAVTVGGTPPGEVALRLP